MLRKNNSFHDRVYSHPDFDRQAEFAALEARLGNTLELVQGVIDEKILPREVACRFWADTFGVAAVDIYASIVTDEAIALIPPEVARKTNVMGLYVVDKVLTMAMADPADTALVQRMEKIIGAKVSPVFAMPLDLAAAINIHYCTEKNLEESLSELAKSGLFDRSDLPTGTIAELAETESMIKILNEVVYFALRERATDIHVEAQETLCRIRFRIDGNLREIATYSRKIHQALICRVKILSALNISENRFPQDGRFSMPVGSHTANFRVSTIPSAYGEKLVVRILAMAGQKTLLTLEKMMVSQRILQPFKRLVKNPSGIIFVTGPTGSGKTTTLYAALHEINTPEVNISTIEDPIEIQLAGVNQSQVNSHIDLKFSTILRALLRQDPDVILIGEVRDLETAKIAAEAALTGHLVFASLHTNTAVQAIVRLLEIGVAPYMVAPSITGILTQRLAARICESCKEAYYPPLETLRKYFKDEGLTEVPFYRGRGCPACRGTGYKGRIAFHEFVLMTEEIRMLISAGRSGQEIAEAAAKVGYRSLRYDGLKKVLLGLTTIDEIEQNTAFEVAT
jgi:type IV pilus assembly protein PilB